MNSASAALRQPEPGTHPAGQYLTFVLGGETYAVSILRIREIIEFGTVTAVPMMPAFIRGVINLRGAVVPVVDLQARFGKAVTEIGRRTCIVILEVDSEGDRQDIGVLVDAVNAVLDIAPADVEPPPSFGTGIRPDFVEAMARIGGRFVIMLDLSRVLSVEELASLAGVQDDPVGHSR